MPEFDRVVAEVIASLCEEDKQWIALMESEDELLILHHTMGQWIRNKFKLWHTSPLTQRWRDDPDSRVIQDGADHSPDHPDQLSMTIIEAVWRQLRRDILHKP